jgi:hypothetical protein
MTVTIKVAVATLVTEDNDSATGSCVINAYASPEAQKTEYDTSVAAAIEQAIDSYHETISDNLPAAHRIVVQVMEIPVKIRYSTFHVSVPEALEEPTADISIIPA